MSQGKLRVGVMPKKRDWHDVLLTIISSDASQEEILQMTPRQRREARERWERQHADPSYRSWRAEASEAWGAYGRQTEFAGFVEYLRSRDREDLSRDITGPDKIFHCGRCHQSCDRPYCVPGERKWLCLSCTAGQPALCGL